MQYFSHLKKLNTIFHGGHLFMFCSDTWYSTYHLMPKHSIEALNPGTATMAQFWCMYLEKRVCSHYCPARIVFWYCARAPVWTQPKRPWRGMSSKSLPQLFGTNDSSDCSRCNKFWMFCRVIHSLSFSRRCVNNLVLISCREDPGRRMRRQKYGM